MHIYWNQSESQLMFYLAIEIRWKLVKVVRPCYNETGLYSSGCDAMIVGNGIKFTANDPDYLLRDLPKHNAIAFWINFIRWLIKKFTFHAIKSIQPSITKVYRPLSPCNPRSDDLMFMQFVGFMNAFSANIKTLFLWMFFVFC